MVGEMERERGMRERLERGGDGWGMRERRQVMVGNMSYEKFEKKININVV